MNWKNYNPYLPLKILCVVFAVVSLAACSRKKNKWVNRNFHAMGAYYNTIYNGQMALEQGKEELAQNYRDNYWEVLPIERMQVEEEVTKPGESKNPNFERAEEKANKAIQKHNMNIQGREYNPQMDKAFILLGKARYYDQRFVPALDAFNYVLNNYRQSDQLVEASVWREKTNMRLGNNELALENLHELLKSGVEVEEEVMAETYATLAQAYLNLEEQQNAIKPLNLAIASENSDEKRARYLFIKGQLYERLGKIDSANVAFNQVIELNRKGPRVYMISAYLEKAKNYDLTKKDKLALETHLHELAEDRENRPFLDRIYHRMAEFYKTTDSIDAAISYYNQSLRTNTLDRVLKSKDYLRLGNIYFDKAEYKDAGAYYDSTLTNLAENTRKYRDIKKKRENLVDVIKYEEIAQETDSILSLVAMKPESRRAYFKTYADSLKQIAITSIKEAEKAGKTPTSGTPDFGKLNETGQTSRENSGQFYFYNTSRAARGELQFFRIWGDIDLADNWRYKSSKSGGSKAKEINQTDVQIAELDLDPQYQAQTYIDKIPQKKEVIDSIKTDRNFAYYQLGVIYKEKFQEYPLAIDKFEKLLKQNPEERLILPSKYNLFKIYEVTGNRQKAEVWKQDILTKHPDSRYAKVLRNPGALKDDKNSPEAIYKNLYQAYQNEKYAYVITEAEKQIERFTGTDIVPKFELLKATATGRLYGFEAYKKGLNYVALTYPQSEEGKRAEEIIQKSLPALKNKTFTKPKPGQTDSYKLVYPFTENNREKLVDLQAQIDQAIADLGLTGIKTSIDNYTPDKNFLVIHGLKSKMGAEGFGERLLEDEKIKISHENFGISAVNYQTLQVHKNLEEYLEFKSQ